VSWPLKGKSNDSVNRPGGFLFDWSLDVGPLPLSFHFHIDLGVNSARKKQSRRRELYPMKLKFNFN